VEHHRDAGPALAARVRLGKCAYWVNEGPRHQAPGAHLHHLLRRGTGASIARAARRRDDANLLDPAAWKKSPQPVFITSEHNGVSARATTVHDRRQDDILVTTPAITATSRATQLHDPTGTPAPKPSTGTETARPISVCRRAQPRSRPTAFRRRARRLEKFTAPIHHDADAQRVLAIARNATKHALTVCGTTAPTTNRKPRRICLHPSEGPEQRAVHPPPAEQAFSLAVMLRLGLYDPKSSACPQPTPEAKALKLIRSIAHQHKANQAKGWGDHWQSARGPVGRAAAWLLWDKLPETDRTQVERMVVYEADRFIDYPAPYYRDRPAASSSRRHQVRGKRLEQLGAECRRHHDAGPPAP